MINIFSLPLGIKEYTTKDVRKIDFISSVVLEESELWGYKKIITPIFEKINSFSLIISNTPPPEGINVNSLTWSLYLSRISLARLEALGK